MLSSTENSSSCPLCSVQGKEFQPIDTLYHGQRYDIYKCPECFVCYTHPFPSTELLNQIYSGEYWLRESVARAPKKFTGFVQKFNRFRLAAMIKPLTKRLKPGDKILEVGCGSGQLAIHLQHCGFDVEVTDISPEVLSDIHDQYNIKGYCGDLMETSFPGKTYKAIIFNNVLEHLDAPDKTLQKASQILEQDGMIFIEVPNIDSLQFKLFRQNWFPLQLPEHLFHFSPNALSRISEKLALKQVWLSTFSPRVSPAGYVASLFPSMRPESLRRSMSKPLLALYLVLQLLFYPLTYIEALFTKGSAVRVIYQRQSLHK